MREPVRASLMNGAQKLREAIKLAVNTTDLMVPNDMNMFWHTGMGNNVTAGNVQSKRPQKWIWQVANGCVPRLDHAL